MASVNPIKADLSIHAAMRAVSQALKLDGDNQQTDAYIHYLKCIQYIVQILLHDAQRPVFTQNSKKCLKLGQQCVGRVGKLLDVFLSLPSVSPGTKGSYSQDVPVVPPATPTTPHTPVSDGASPLAGRVKSLTPIEHAQRQNQQLMVAYKNRMAKLGNKSSARTANMSLTLQRQMAENMAIAKTRQLALSKKMAERQKRFQEEAAKRLASMGGMSNDEKQRMHLYTKILEYEQDMKWPQIWRQKLKQQPEDEAVTLELIKTILSATDHPLAQLFHKYQRTIYNKVYPLVMKHIHLLTTIKVPYEGAGILSFCDGDSSLDASVRDTCPGETGRGAERNQNAELEPNEYGSVSSSHGGGDGIHAGTSEPPREDANAQGKGDAAKMENICQEVKRDLKTAMNDGQKVMDKLSEENRNIMRNLDVSFDMDEMDDLFDDSEEESETAGAAKTSTSSTSSSLPYSSLTSRESVESTGTNEESHYIEELEIDAMRRHLQNVILDVKESLDRLLGMFLVTYEQLGSPAGRDLCYSYLEENFIKPLWPTILPLFRLANKQKEETVAMVMTKHQNALPADLKVSTKFCMQDEDKPYLPVIQELGRLIQLTSPLNKLESIVKLCRLICQCVEEYYQGQDVAVECFAAQCLGNDPVSAESAKMGGEVFRGHSQEPTCRLNKILDPPGAPCEGADDLLPVMCFVIVKSGAPQVVSECNAMEEFIPEGYLMGEEGYCLTSLQTALGYCLRLNDEVLTP